MNENKVIETTAGGIDETERGSRNRRTVAAAAALLPPKK